MIELKALSIADINKLDRLFMKAATAALETVKSNVNSAKNNKQVDYQYLQLHDDEIAQYIRLFIESPLNRLAFKQQDNPWLELDTKQNDLKDSLLILGNNLIESIDMLSILETPRCIAERLALPIMVYTLFSNN